MLRDSRLVGRERLLDNATEPILLRTVAALLPKVVVPTRGTHCDLRILPVWVLDTTMICGRLTHIRKLTQIRIGHFRFQLPTTVGHLLGNIYWRMPATVSRRILVTTVTIALTQEGKARRLRRRLRSSEGGHLRELLRFAIHVPALPQLISSRGLSIMVGEHRHTVDGAANRQIMKRTLDIGMLAVWSCAITRQEWQ
jgi:hypothetical protein